MRDHICFVVGLMTSLFYTSISEGAPTLVRDARTSPASYITLEEHYDSEAMRAYQTDPVYTLLIDALGNSTTPLLRTINGSRLNSMNKNKIRIQAGTLNSTMAVESRDGIN